MVWAVVRIQSLVLAMALAGCGGNHAGSSATASASTKSWQLESFVNDGTKVCVLSRTTGPSPVSLIHLRFPHAKDGGRLDFQFVEPKLNEVAKQRTSVVLEFDTGPLEGYQLRDYKNGTIGVRMMTYALSDLFEAFEDATLVNVKTSTASAVIDLSGLSASIQDLRDCATP